MVPFYRIEMMPSCFERRSELSFQLDLKSVLLLTDFSQSQGLQGLRSCVLEELFLLGTYIPQTLQAPQNPSTTASLYIYPVSL